jgi:hypothetical protein
MPSRVDATVIPENLACEIAGLAPSKRRDWVKKGLLDQPTTKAKLSELQVVQLALVRELHDVLGSRDGGVIWLEVQRQLASRVPVGHLDVVVDLGYREVALVSEADGLSPAVRTTRAVRVIPMEDLISRVREAFRRVAAVQTGSEVQRAKRNNSASA